MQAAASPVAKDGPLQRARDFVEEGWYAAKAACGGVVGRLQHWLVMAWHWLQHLWAQVVHAVQQAVQWVREHLPKNIKPTAAS